MDVRIYNSGKNKAPRSIDDFIEIATGCFVFGYDSGNPIVFNDDCAIETLFRRE